MADPRRYALGNQLDVEQILLEAQQRWLRPAEICEILRNYKNFQISAEAPTLPPSGSLFLFDRKVLRYFRKDGHNWRKKKDGKTIKEAHEKLKVGSVDVLHCYYAHGEENEHFQRRCYWMLEDELSHIVFVHYLEVKGNRANYNRGKESEPTTPYSQVTGESVPNAETESSMSSRFYSNNGQVFSHTDTTSPNSALATEYEDVESVYIPQAASGFHSFRDLRQPTPENCDAGTSAPYVSQPYTSSFQGKSAISGMDLASIQAAKDKYESQKHLYSGSWEDIFENCTPGLEPSQYSALGPSPQSNPMGRLLGDYMSKNQVSDVDSSCLSEFPMDLKLHSDSANHQIDIFHGQEVNYFNSLNFVDPRQMQPDMQINNSVRNNSQTCLSNGEHYNVPPPDSVGYSDGKSIYASAIKQRLLDGSSTEDGLKKVDSFNRWMSKELEDVTDVDESRVQTNSGADWEAVEKGNMIDVSSIPSERKTDTLLGPSLSQDQLFSIVDFSPNWAYVGSETEVLITGRFLKSSDLIQNIKWSCMFGEIEVPADLVADGVLYCYTPQHEAGWVPFYVTCSNRVACSEVREFEYRASHSDEMNSADDYRASEDLLLRFVELLDLSSSFTYTGTSRSNEISELSSKISSLLMDGTLEWDEMLKLSAEEEFPPERLKEELNQKLFKEKLRTWLLQKVNEDGKGPSVLDEGGQGVLHFAAALGFDWAFEPTVLAGVNINFRDANGWTALHWAAFCGRERAVATLLSLGADPGLVTDPSPKYLLGRAPAELASANGHKGIAGYLGEASLSSVLGRLTLENQEGVAAGSNAVNEFLERSPVSSSFGYTSDGLSVEDSLAVVRNATQAFSRIHQAYRVQSFRKKQLKEYGNDKFGMSDEQALSMVAVKPSKPGQKDEPVHSAAIRIQNKYRSYKGRKQFLIIREKIVKIQALVRGHQVRKSYKKIVWSVGILEKVILRWRRKGSGLRGFKPEALPEAPNMLENTSKGDDDDFLKEGKKQAEERMEKALARVKSMVQYPEGRDQYRRLLNVVTEIQAKKLGSPSPSNFDEDLIDIEALLDNDTFMSTVL